MPSWVFVLFLAIAVAAFLVILRQLRGLKLVIAEQQRDAASEDAPEGPPPPREEPLPVPGIAEIEQGLARVSERLTAIQEEMQLLSIEVKSAAQPGPDAAAPAAPAAPPTPEQVAREYLAREGYSQIQIDSRRPEAGGVRFVVKARRGEEIRIRVGADLQRVADVRDVVERQRIHETDGRTALARRPQRPDRVGGREERELADAHGRQTQKRQTLQGSKGWPAARIL